MVIRYATLAALAAVSIWALITVGASHGQWLLAGTDEAQGQGDTALWLLAAIAATAMGIKKAYFIWLAPPHRNA